MTLEQLKTYTVGVLKGWFTNKDVIDGLGESEGGNLTYKGKEIVGGTGSGEGSGGTQQPVVGRKMYKISDDISITKSTNTATHPTAQLTDSISNYDAVVAYCIMGDYMFPSAEIPVSIADDKLFVCFFSNSSTIELWIKFMEKSVFIEAKAPNDSVVSVYGIKYETVSEDPTTDAEVTQAVTETMEALDATDADE